MGGPVLPRLRRLVRLDVRFPLARVRARHSVQDPCEADDIDPEDVIPFEHDGSDYAIYRSPDDAYYATDGHCTHEETLLCDGLVMGGVIECPKHNGRFDYTSGKALGAPVLVDVRTYPTKVLDGTVYIEVG